LPAAAAVAAAAGFCLVLLGFTLCYWVLPCVTGFCLVLLGFTLYCWVLPCTAGFCLELLDSALCLGFALCFWVLLAAAGFCLPMLRQCAMPQCTQYFVYRFPLPILIQPSDFIFREFAAARARISF